MHATALVTLNMRELDRLKMVQAVVDGKLQPWRAADRLEPTTRQIRRLAARFREHGPAGLVSGHRTKPGNRRLDGELAARALAIIRERYADFGPTLACEKLWECQHPRAVQRLQDRGFSENILTASRQPLAVLLATSGQVTLVARRSGISLA